MKAKIFGRRGASMLIAILVFFLAVLSGTVALTMAASNAGRYTHAKEDQQSYLSVASAARLILTTLNKVQIEVRSNGPSVPETAENLQPKPILYEKKTQTKISPGLFFRDERFQKNLNRCAIGGTADVYPVVSFSLALENNANAGSVWVSVEMSDSNITTIHLWSEHGSERDYQMTMRVTFMWSILQWHAHYTTGHEGDNSYLEYYYRQATWDTEHVEFSFNEGGARA